VAPDGSRANWSALRAERDAQVQNAQTPAEAVVAQAAV
jgi:hypothetical protein